MKLHHSIQIWLVLLLTTVLCWTSVAQAVRPGWKRQEVNWRTTGGARIKAIHYPLGKKLPIPTKQDNHQQKQIHKKLIPPEANSRLGLFAQDLTTPIYATVIDSPPIGGFVPWIAVSVTDRRSAELEFEAIPSASVVGRFLTSNPQVDYAIGIFDTGASAHVMSGAGATRVGLFDHTPDLITSNLIEVYGVTGSVDVWVSQPIGLFIDGLGAIDSNGLLPDNSAMVGQTNVSISVGDPIDSPNLPTAIGTPLSVFFTTVFNNEQQITVTLDNEEFTGPDLLFYENNDPCIPNYSNVIPLELRPLGAVSVQYLPSLEGLFEFPPASPSTIIGNLSQSLFFVHSVDITEGENTAIDKDRFMFDTGAQVTVIGSRIAARLQLDTSNPEFEEEITDVTGATTMVPGFYIDSIEIPALGEWLSFTNVPVILLDVASPEGGTLDGIIGMNLFVEFNLVLRGGGLFLQDDPTLEFKLIQTPIIADIAPQGGDGIVDFLDFAALAKSWLATPTSPNWNPKANIAPSSSPDSSIDILDLAVFTEFWLY